MYRNIARLAPALVRGYSTQGSGAAPFAVSAFANQQAKFRALTEGSEKIPVPHDDAGFTKFASEYNALKAKVPLLCFAPNDACVFLVQWHIDMKSALFANL